MSEKPMASRTFPTRGNDADLDGRPVSSGVCKPEAGRIPDRPAPDKPRRRGVVGQFEIRRG